MDRGFDSSRVDFERDDLVAVLAFRFGLVSGPVRRSIEELDDLTVLERLIVAAETMSTWDEFLHEFKRETTVASHVKS